MPPEFLDDPSSQLRQFPKEMRPFLRDLIKAGWRFRKGGHKWRATCWCDEPRHMISISGTPRNPTYEGKRLKRAAEKWHPAP